MKTKISIISDDMVLPDKKLVSNQVSGVMEIESLEEFAYMATHSHIAPATFHHAAYNPDWSTSSKNAWLSGQTGYWKNLANLEQIQWLCFDFDNGAAPSSCVHVQLEDINHIILASKSHLLDKNDGNGTVERFHVFIPTTEQITNKEFYKYVCKRFAEKKQWSVDASVMEASRYFYKHKEQLFIEMDKSALALFGYRESFDLKTEQHSYCKKRFQGMKWNYDGSCPFNKTEAFRIMARGGLASDGNRYYTSSKILGTMIKCGLRLDEVMELFDKYAAYGDSFTRESVERRFSEWN